MKKGNDFPTPLRNTVDAMFHSVEGYLRPGGKSNRRPAGACGDPADRHKSLPRAVRDSSDLEAPGLLLWKKHSVFPVMRFGYHVADASGALQIPALEKSAFWGGTHKTA